MIKKTDKKSFNNGIKICLQLILIFLIIFSLLSGCKKNSDSSSTLVGNWIKRSDFEGVARSEAVAFTIGDKAYVGTGYDGSDRLADFWEYDPQQDNWLKKADYPGIPRNGAVGFGTDTKGYIGLGYDGVNKLKDFWEYDPVTDTWDSIPDFGGSARYGAVAFVINNKGYVGTGYDGNYLKDFWEYDPSTKQWTQKLSLRGAKRRDAVAFVIDEKGFVCTGVDNGTYEHDFWEYDPSTDEWTDKRDIANVSDNSYDDDYTYITGTNKVAFTINGKGYIATGGPSTAGTTVWEYNPSSDLWTQKTALEASARMEAVGFAIGDLGYVLTGRDYSLYFDDMWGFKPNDEQVDNDKIVAENGIISNH